MFKRGTPSLHWLMLAGFTIGVAAGLAANQSAGADAAAVQWITSNITGPIGNIFLRLLFMLTLPLLFSALAAGVAGMGDLASLGRVGAKTLALTVVFSTIAVLIGLGMVNWFRPGDGVDPLLAQRLLAEGASGAQAIIQRAPENVQA